jgi:arylsulfatase
VRDSVPDPGGPSSTGPCSRGFDRFYGVSGGETNQWYPTLVEDNHSIDQEQEAIAALARE